MRKKLAGGREGTSWDDLMKSREVQLPGEEVPDPRGGGQDWRALTRAGQCLPQGLSPQDTEGSPGAPGLCSSSAALSTLQAEL